MVSGQREQPAGIISAHTTSIEVRRVPSVTRLIRVLPQYAVWRRSAGILTCVLRNVVLSLVGSCLALLCCSSGNVFTGQSTREQSYATFFSAVLTWNNLFLGIAMWVSQASLLMRQRLADRPDICMGLQRSMIKIARPTGPYFVLTLTVIPGFIYLLDHLAGEGLRPYRIEFYVSCFTGHAYITYVELISRRIFFEQTVKGRAVLRNKSVVRKSDVNKPRKKETGLSLKVKNPRSNLCLQFVRLYVFHLPVTLSLMFAGLYVHVVSRTPIRSEFELLTLAGCSILLKLAVQEIIKLAILRKNIQDPRTMFISVGFPTVLIDTQVRVMLQLVRNANSTVTGSAILAGVEILFRWSKVLILELKIRQSERLLRQRPRVKSVIGDNSIVPVLSDPTLVGTSATIRRFDQWRQRMIRFHASEVYADMAAEYIAIGCSAIIVYAYAQHPKYALGTSSATSTKYITLGVIAIQVGLELLVDLVSGALELAHGVDFDSLRQHANFVAVTFVGIGIMNIQVSAVMYLKSD